ncbi:MAG TPA: hypothetical protein VHM29_07270, partial [Acidimicrobiia bacterium]|nr:hypothetical protein [Acidimicrobiia bacterium]
MTGGTSLWGTTYFLALFAAVLALPTSWFLLRRYRGSILRLMNERSSGVQEIENHRPTPDHPRPTEPLHSEAIEVGMRRNVIVVVVVALVSGTAFAALFLVWTDVGISIWRLSTFAILYTWPAVIGIWIVTGGRRRWVITSIAVYFIALFIAVMIAGGSWDVPAQLFLFSLVPTAAIIGFLSRRFRGVGALVLGTMMVALAGSQAFAFAVLGSDPLITAWAEFLTALGVTNGMVAWLALIGVGFVLSLALGIVATRLLAGWYERYGFSDQMLILGSTFLVFAIDQSGSASTTEGGPFGIGLVIYLAAGAVAFALYRLIHRRVVDPTCLLMLRVFSSDPTRQRLLDQIASGWRYLGPVRMIGGPDLAVNNVEPDEFLTFVSGRTRTLFVNGPADLAARISRLETRPDRDARYRIDEFFCFDDTWRPAVSQLLAQCDAV